MLVNRAIIPSDLSLGGPPMNGATLPRNSDQGPDSLEKVFGAKLPMGVPNISVNASDQVFGDENCKIFENRVQEEAQNEVTTGDSSLEQILEERTELEASIDAKIDQELMEFTTGRKEIKKGSPMAPKTELRANSATSAMPLAPVHQAHSTALINSQLTDIQTLSAGRDTTISQSAPALKQNNSSFGLESSSIGKKPSLSVSDSVDDLLTLKPPDIDTTRVLLDSGAVPSTVCPEIAEKVVQQVKESGTAEDSPQIKSLTGIDLISGPPSLSDTPKRVSFEVSENPSDLDAATQKLTMSSEEPRRSSLKPISEASSISILSMPNSNHKSQPELSPFAAVVSPRRNEVQSFRSTPKTQPNQMPNPFANAQPSREDVSEVQSSRSTPKNQPHQMPNPFANAQPSREDISENQQVDLSSASPFETASYQERPIAKPGEELEKAKTDAAKLSASISSSAQVPTPSDVSRAIMTHNFSNSDVSKLDTESSSGVSKSMGVESRKASRVPSLETVREDCASCPDLNEIARKFVENNSGFISIQSESSSVKENPAVAHLRNSQGLSSSIPTHSEHEESLELPSKRDEGMKSLSILETEGIPQLRNLIKQGQPGTASSSNGTPSMRHNLAHEPYKPHSGTDIPPSLHGPKNRAQTLPTAEFNSLLDSLQNDQSFNGSQILGTILSGNEYKEPVANDSSGEEEDMSGPQSLQRAIGNFKPAASLVGSPPPGPSLIQEVSKESEKSEQTAEWIIPFDELEFGRKLGVGSYGEVFRAQWRCTDVAVKRMTNVTESHLEEFQQEVCLMAKLKHPNVVQFLGACVDLPNLSIVTQFMPRGSLFNLLHRSNCRLDDKSKLWMAMDCAKGMHYLHSCKPPIVHGDVSSKNMLVDRDLTIRVADFGMSRQKHKEKLSCSKAAGTAEWTAPEVLRGLPYSEKADVFSFGVILHELMTQQIPWEELTPYQVTTAVGWNHERLDIPEVIDPRISSIIQHCFEREPEKRPTFEAIILSLRNIRGSLLQKESEVEPKASRQNSQNPASNRGSIDRPERSNKFGIPSPSPKTSRRSSAENARKFQETQQKRQEDEAKIIQEGRLSRSQSLESRKTL